MQKVLASLRKNPAERGKAAQRGRNREEANLGWEGGVMRQTGVYI
jgi:hypothetical protein